MSEELLDQGAIMHVLIGVGCSSSSFCIGGFKISGLVGQEARESAEALPVTSQRAEYVLWDYFPSWMWACTRHAKWLYHDATLDHGANKGALTLRGSQRDLVYGVDIGLPPVGNRDHNSSRVNISFQRGTFL